MAGMASNGGTKFCAAFADPLAKRPCGGNVLVLDGGLATHIESLGVDIDHALWSAKCLVENPSAIKRAHSDFYASGADVAITASYQAHFDGFKELGVSEDAALDAMKKSVALAREVAPAGGLVAGSVGSYGASLHNGAEYTGDFPDMDEEKLLAWHLPRAKALVEAGCDVLACETVPCLLEARALARMAAEVKHPAWVTFSCKSGTEVCSGDLFVDCVAAVADNEYIVGCGVNCSDPKLVASLVSICRARLPAAKHVVVYPNSGEVWCGKTHTWISGVASADEQFVEYAKEWAKRGADCIGGCCRTNPSTIAALRKAFASTDTPLEKKAKTDA